MKNKIYSAIALSFCLSTLSGCNAFKSKIMYVYSNNLKEEVAYDGKISLKDGSRPGFKFEGWYD